MCLGDTADEKARPVATVRCTSLDSGTWALGVALSANHPAYARRPPTRIHFVLDNSGSMGQNTQHARGCFSELVDLANGPCSLTVFESQATTLGEGFKTASAMRAVPLPRQGGTNITAGIEEAVSIIKRCEAAEAGCERTHHVLVLLSDGAHTRGPSPEARLPVLGAELRVDAPMLRLSVVVVGVTRSSNTSMGMLLKQSLETVALPSLDPIYFADTPHLMGEVLQQMHGGFASLRGSVVTIGALGAQRFVRAVGEAGVPSVDVLVASHEQALLCMGDAPPAELTVDGISVPCALPPSEAADFDTELAASALQALVDAVRVRRVAIGAEAVRPALQQLGSWMSSLEAQAAAQRASVAGTELHLAKATPAERVAQHKALKRATLGVRELRNQLAEVEAHSANDSASQAAFLTGASSKFGARALRRAAAYNTSTDGATGLVDPQLRLQELLADLEGVASKMKQALRKDFCAKLAALADGPRKQLHERLVAVLPSSVPRRAIASLCSGNACTKCLAADAELAALVDSGAAVEPLLTVTGGVRRSYVSLYTAWEQLKEWSDSAIDAAATCHTEYQLLMYLGTLGYPIDVQRRAATQMDPFAMDVTRLRSSLADTASLSTALQSEQSVVPPEGGIPVQDLLVLVDPDAPRASRLAASSILLREAYTSVVLCRDLHMYTGNKMRVALHAHALLAALQPPPPTITQEDLEAQLRRQYLGRAFQCAQCAFGPIDHFACEDLASHHGEDVGGGAVINNACPSCGWFSEDLSDWPRWDGTVPPSAFNRGDSKAGTAEEARSTAGALEIALRICYSARAVWRLGADSEARALCDKLVNWETLTAADGVDHPVQLLLALAVLGDVPDDALGTVPTLALLNEVCARLARDQLRQSAGTDESAVLAAAQKRVAAFLGVTKASAPNVATLAEPEPRRQAVVEACRSDYALDSSGFDFKAWVRDTLMPWVPALRFVRRLRSVLRHRQGGWPQLERDMEAGPDMYTDVVSALHEAPGRGDTLKAWLGVEHPREAPRVLAAVTAQAFLHHSSQLRRTAAAGGALAEPLGDVRDGATLSAIAVDLRMATYDECVVGKMREWGRLGASITFQRARAVDLDQYASLCGTHVHSLDGPTFWGLWRAATGEKAREFLRTANQGFVNKHSGS